MKSGCATALVLNKWDLTSGDDFDLDHERARVARKLRLRPKVMTASRVDRPPRAAAAASRRSSLADRCHHRIPTPELNRFLGDVVADAPAAAEAGPPAEAALHRPDRRGAAALLDPGQHRDKVTRDYAYFVENRLRERYALEGIPVIIDFAERKQRRRAA